MNAALKFQPISAQDYLRGEDVALRKHEYVNGDVYMMSGGTVQHSRIAVNAIGSLYAQLRGKPCQVFNSDMKVRLQLPSGLRFYYPDVSVVCQPNAAQDSYHDKPVIIIEVLSESTRRCDEFEKREAYLALPSVQVYVLFEQSTAAAVVYRRSGAGFDRDVVTGMESRILLPEIDCELAFAEIYQNVEFQPERTDDDLS